jgi:CheY-like chemotaxis protein
MKDHGRTVLVVARTPAARRDLGSWLEDEGEEVMMCPGPGAPDYTCIGSRDDRCVLAEAADVVVIDLELAGDVAMAGTPGWQLFLYYVSLGKKVVAIFGSEDPIRPLADDQVAVVRRPAEPREIIDAIRALRAGEVYGGLARARR